MERAILSFFSCSIQHGEPVILHIGQGDGRLRILTETGIVTLVLSADFTGLFFNLLSAVFLRRE